MPMLFFLYGPDTYRKSQKLKQLVEEFIKKRDPSRLNVITLEAGGTDEETLRATLRAAPFLAAKRMVVLKNFLSEGRRKGLHEILEETLPALGEERIAIISEDEEKPKKAKDWKNQTAKKVWEYLEKDARCEAFPELSGARLEKEIYALAKAHDLTLQKDAAAMLAVFSGGDLGWVEREIEKLEAYCAVAPPPQSSPIKGEEDKGDSPPLAGGVRGGGGQRHTPHTITPSHITLLCTAEGEANIFEFLDALGNRDRKTLLRAAQEQLREIDAVRLIPRATGQIRALLAINLAGQAGAQALGLHPFVARKATAQARKWTAPELKKVLFALMSLEYQAKTGRAADPTTQLTALLTQIAGYQFLEQ